MSRPALFLVLIAAECCRGGHAPRNRAALDGGGKTLAVPVKVAEATRKNVPVLVSGPGRTASIETHEVRAPFDGVLTDLVVSDGDHVTGGQVLGWVVSRESEAALVGARKMLASATTQEQRRAARRALTLAERGLVKVALRAPEDGIVLSHRADEEARLAANQSIVTIVATDSVVFIANIAQVDLDRVRPGQPASIVLASNPIPRQATVYAVLPGGSATDLTAPVRLDFAREARPSEINLFGVAHLTVGMHADALVVPRAAVLRNDMTGLSRVAIVDRSQRVHWLKVDVGLGDGSLVELRSPSIQPGTRLVVSGLVGLPEGTQVQVGP